MGAVTSLFRKRSEIQTLMLGLDAAGKTTILYKLKLGEVTVTIPTIGFNVETVKYTNRQKIVSFTTWDVGGRCGIRPLWRHWYAKMNSLIFVVDSADKDDFRVESTREELQKMLAEDELKDKPLLVFANKQDLPHAFSVKEIVEKLGLHNLRQRRWYIQGSTATTGEGLYEGLDWLQREVERSQGIAPASEENAKGDDSLFGEKLALTAKTGLASKTSSPHSKDDDLNDDRTQTDSTADTEESSKLADVTVA